MHGGDAAMIADVLMPVAVDTAYSYRSPSGLAVRPGDIVRGSARPAPDDRRRLGDPRGAFVRASEPQVAHRQGRYAGPAESARRFRRLGGSLDARAPRPRLAHGAARHERGPPEAPRVGVRIGAATPQRLTPARMRALATAGKAGAGRLAHQAGARARGGREHLGHRRPHRCGRARNRRPGSEKRKPFRTPTARRHAFPPRRRLPPMCCAGKSAKAASR